MTRQEAQNIFKHAVEQKNTKKHGGFDAFVFFYCVE